jgi:hypothetical protein
MKTLLAVTFAVSLLASCESGPRGRVMADTDQDYVGNRAAGAETFDRLISESVERTLAGHTAARTGNDPLKVVSLPVENASAEELGDWQEQIYELIDTSINRSERYTMISQRFVDAALREARLRPDELFIPAKRRTFVAILEQEGQPVDLLLFPRLTSGTTSAGQGVTQRNYLLNLELVDLKSGESFKYSSKPLRKEYQR